MKKKNRWSYTKIKTFMDCPEKFYRKYVLKDYPEENNIKYLEGNVLQNLFEHFINHKHYKSGDKTWLLDNIYDYYIKYYTSNRSPCHFRKADSEKKFMSSIKKMVENTYNMFKYKKFLEEDCKIKSEVSISKTLSDKCEVFGKIDFVAIQDKKWIAFDLKSRKTKYIDKLQLHIYALLIYLSKGRLIDQAFFFTSKDNKVLNLNIKQKDLDNAKELILNIDKTTSSSKYREMTEDKKKCWGCAYKTECWKENRYKHFEEIQNSGIISFE